VHWYGSGLNTKRHSDSPGFDRLPTVKMHREHDMHRQIRAELWEHLVDGKSRQERTLHERRPGPFAVPAKKFDSDPDTAQGALLVREPLLSSPLNTKRRLDSRGPDSEY
jgi:hypothetical protein